MEKEQLVNLIKSLKYDYPTDSVERGYNKALDTSSSLVEAYME